MTANKIRLRFAKEGDLRLVSHHDLLRCFERVLRRAGLPVARTQGFNPRPKLTFAQALALGIAARREVLDLELDRPLDPSEALNCLAAAAPPGLTFSEVETCSDPRAPRAVSADYRLDLPAGRVEEARRAAQKLLDDVERPFVRRRPDRTVDLDLRPFIVSIHIDDQGTLRFRLKIDPSGSARPEEIVETLELRDLLEGGSVLIREDLHLTS